MLLKINIKVIASTMLFLGNTLSYQHRNIIGTKYLYNVFYIVLHHLFPIKDLDKYNFVKKK